MASAGETLIKLFDPEHHELTSITNSNEPCGLAVDSKGNLYVSELATRKVVRYTPNAYPFIGTPTYGPPTIVDASGSAAGIAVDPVTDNLYIAEGDHIAVYESDGSFVGKVGEGVLTKASGVAAYTSATGTLYLSAADANGELLQIFSGPGLTELKLRQTIERVDEDRNPETPDQSFGFGSADTYLSAEAGSGHLFLYDALHSVVDEFEASGQFLDQISNPGFADAEPTAVAVVPQRNEVQGLHISAKDGFFTLKFEGQTTPPLPATRNLEEPSGEEVETALESLPAIGAGNVSVFGHRPASSQSGNYSIVFTGVLGHRDVPQLEADGSALEGTSPSATVITVTSGSGPGRLYVTSGAVAAAKLLAFGPLAEPSRPPRPDLSFELKNVVAVAVDSFGNRYVAADKFIRIYDNSGVELAKIEDKATKGGPFDLAVDSAGHVYALDGIPNSIGEGRVVYFTPQSYPPQAGTNYTESAPIATTADFSFPSSDLRAIGLNPADDHLFVTQQSQTIELDSAAHKSKILNSNFAPLIGGERSDFEGYAANGNIYMFDAFNDIVLILDPTGTEVITRISGRDSPKGPFAESSGAPGGGVKSMAVDQATGHVLVFSELRGVAEEYESSGAFVSQFGKFEAVSLPSKIAIDNSGGLNNGSAYVVYLHHLTAFGGLAYGEPPVAVTGMASDANSGQATLNGSVDPRGFAVKTCHFEYLSEAAFQENKNSEKPLFTNSEEILCIPTELGKGTSAVAVHADIAGLDPDGHYRFRLVAENEYGKSEGKAARFGPPVILTTSAQSVSYLEAAVRATIDSFGLPTKYRVEYGATESYGTSTPWVEMAPGEGATDVVIHLFGLVENMTYHYRVLAENEAKAVAGSDQTLTTLVRRPQELCVNAEYRTGFSTNLPDCRAYELVTPADTRGMSPYGALSAFNAWLVTPRGALAGQSLAFFVNGTLPGFEGNGRGDAYRALRGSGSHPSEGWESDLVGPSYTEIGGGADSALGIAADQEYAFWKIFSNEVLEGTLSNGTHLRTPAGFEPDPLGQGSLGSDLKAEGNFLSPGGTNIIFSSEAHLEEVAAPEGTEALYDRTPTGTEVVSVMPSGSPFGAGQDATYIAASEDGSTVLFKVGGVLYLHHDGTTVEVAAGPNAFAGMSEGGERVFYVDAAVQADTPAPAGLFACDVASGPCAGPEAVQTPIEIAADSRFVNVSSDGSTAFFTSEDVLTGAEENEAGETAQAGEGNLYVWDGGAQTTKFVSRLDAKDLELQAFEGPDVVVNLIRWPAAIGPGGSRGVSPTRSTPDGSVLVFQSHARLTTYDNEERSEIYRFDRTADPGERLDCVSCDPSGAAPSHDATLQSLRFGAAVSRSTLIPNVNDDGNSVFFESEDRLLPEDANSTSDVYEWKAKGVGNCNRARGCLALISSGQGENPSYLYSMTPDGHDVFFRTSEKLVGQDVAGSPSLYDARVEGGIPSPPDEAPCQGDACQGQGGTRPSIPAIATGGADEGNIKSPASCGKHRHRVKGRCVKFNKKHAHNHRPARHSQRTSP